jgi:hypothetical protein
MVLVLGHIVSMFAKYGPTIEADEMFPSQNHEMSLDRNLGSTCSNVSEAPLVFCDQHNGN